MNEKFILNSKRLQINSEAEQLGVSQFKDRLMRLLMRRGGVKSKEEQPQDVKDTFAGEGALSDF